MIFQHWTLPTPTSSQHSFSFTTRYIAGVGNTAGGPIFFGDLDEDIGTEATSLLIATNGETVSNQSYGFLGMVDYGGTVGVRYVFVPKS